LKKQDQKMRAIDLYAGIGGWSLGLRLAGLEVVNSYEWWQPAIDTHNANHGGELKSIDIRQLNLQDLPTDIDVVVGSPPCTEFSYSNRGGSGNLSEGLKDLIKFLEIVEHLKPRFWALENVPRVAQVLSQGLRSAGHPLHRFKHLQPQIEIIDFSEYGAPQSRRRCIVGNVPFELIKEYGRRLPDRTLGDVVRAMATTVEVCDPVWGVRLPIAKVTDMEAEPALNAEELRMNREAKTFHPVYNNMAFPDSLDAPARTVTATCTRVSRESIVISDPRNPAAFRRLTVRERACLQGFPITYQFYARSFAEKAKMVGNAIPPTFTYLVAHAVQGTLPKALPSFTTVGVQLNLPKLAPLITPPDREGRTYPQARTFRAAIRGLRFKSGMRFELANHRTAGGVRWQVRFMFGPSRDIREIELDDEVLRQLQGSAFVQRTMMTLGARFSEAEQCLRTSTPFALQQVWSHRAEGLTPFEVADLLGDLAEAVLKQLRDASNDVQHAAIGYVAEAAAEGEVADEIPGSRKLTLNGLAIFSGLLVGTWFNTLSWHGRRRAAA
jgi:DNA (cytosine-5)-methyltransferase 1